MHVARTMANFFDVLNDKADSVDGLPLFFMKLSPLRKPSFAPRAVQMPVDVLSLNAAWSTSMRSRRDKRRSLSLVSFACLGLD